MPLTSTPTHRFATSLTNWSRSLALLLPLGLSLLPCSAQTQTAAQLSIDTTKIVSPVSPMLYGMMTEEINHAFDGGLYAELLQNRTFRPSWMGIEHWDLVRNGKPQPRCTLTSHSGPSKALPHSMKLAVTSASEGSEAGVSNGRILGHPASNPHHLQGIVLREGGRHRRRPSSPQSSSVTRQEQSSPRRRSI
jgi:hypothetical protein